MTLNDSAVPGLPPGFRGSRTDIGQEGGTSRAGGRTAVAGSEGEAVKATADWRHRAACVGSDHLFLSEDPEDVADAQRICIDCPVFNDCQDYAKQIMPTAGVWAGRDCNDRRKRGKRP